MTRRAARRGQQQVSVRDVLVRRDQLDPPLRLEAVRLHRDARILQFLGITAYVAAHWELATLKSPSFGGFSIPQRTRFRMIVLVGAVGASSVAAATLGASPRLMVGTDHLTGLSQRRPFLERIEEELERSGTRTSLSVALLDVDEFKRFNDSFGHLAGDRALQLLAQRLRKLDPNDATSLRALRRRGVRRRLPADGRRARHSPRERAAGGTGARSTFPTGEGLQHLTVSAGVGSWPEDGQTFDEVLARVDERLYEAKATGRNRVVGPPGQLPRSRTGRPAIQEVARSDIHPCAWQRLCAPMSPVCRGLHSDPFSRRGLTWVRSHAVSRAILEAADSPAALLLALLPGLVCA